MEPGAELTAAMSGRAVAQCWEIKPQDVSNLMWALVVLGLEDQVNAFRVFMDHCNSFSFDDADLVLPQLHQVFLCMELGHFTCSVSSSTQCTELAKRCRTAFERGQQSVSLLQQSVGRRLRGMGLFFTEEVLEQRTGYSIDFEVRPGGSCRWALEVDGPSHFVHGGARPRPNGPTLLKQKLLERAGWRTAAVEYWVWDACAARGADAEREYLEALLQLAPAVGLVTP